jgi:hypothetical protein
VLYNKEENKMELNRKSLFILMVFFIYVCMEIILYNQAVQVISNSNLFLSIMVYIIFNPAYLLLLYSSYKLSQRYGKAIYKRAIGSVFLTLSFMMIEIPRLTITEPLKNGSATITNLGSIVISRLDLIFPHTVSYYLFYMIIPLIFFFFALENIGISNFINKMKNGGL